MKLMRAAAALLLAIALAGCAAGRAEVRPDRTSVQKPAHAADERPMHTAAEFADDEPIVDAHDPWEEFNLEMYRFNYNFDKYIFLPVVTGYEFITPVIVRKGITNFFENVAEVRNLYNSLFQMKGRKAAITLGRFVTNTTIGIGGLFDPATSLGLRKQYEDFGQTLGGWGTGPGPYLVVPVLGPHTVRSAGGFAVDAGIRYALISAPLENNVENGAWVSSGVTAVESVDARHKVAFRYFESGYPFEYYMVRYLYLKYSEFQQLK
jgi:phospholipid-binding lipoprotein MlaA